MEIADLVDFMVFCFCLDRYMSKIYDFIYLTSMLLLFVFVFFVLFFVLFVLTGYTCTDLLPTQIYIFVAIYEELI